ncbi:MAG: HEAT repeat domain-containing protein [bacterium]
MSADAPGRVVKLIAPDDDDLPDLPPIRPGGRPPVTAVDAEALAAAVARIAADTASAEDLTQVVRAEEDGLDALIALFPGTPRLDRHAVDPTSLRPSAHSAVIGAVLRFGARAVPRLEALLDHLSPEVRFYAVSCFAALPAAGSLERISGLLFDKDSTVREAAAAVMERQRAEPAFARASAQVLRALADESHVRRRFAAQAAGRLHLAGRCPP